MIISYNPKNKEYARANRHQYYMAEAEGKIWNLVLKKDATGYRFLRQKCIGNYILDFYCSKLKLGIEIDGESHNGQGDYDEQRTKYLESVGIKIIRYTNSQVAHQLDGVIIDIHGELEDRKKKLSLHN